MSGRMSGRMSGDVAWAAMDRPARSRLVRSRPILARPIRDVLAGPFGWVVAGYGFSSLAFFAFYGTVFAQAVFAHGAGPGQSAIIGAALSIPFIFGSLLQGIVVDHWSPKWISAIGYVVEAAAIVVAWAGDSLTSLYAAAALIGVSFATIEPARSSLTGLLVPEDDLVRANSLMAISFQFALMLGSFGGGVLLDGWGAAAVYAATLVVAGCPILCTLRVPDVRPRGGDAEASLSLREIRTGVRIAWIDGSLRLLLVVTGLGWALVTVFFVLEPIFVRDVLRRPEAALLFLWAVHGCGAVVASVVLAAWVRNSRHEPLIVCGGVAAIGGGILLYAGGASFGLAMAGGALQGIGFSLMYPPLLAFIQRAVTEDQRGRVTGVFVSLQEAMGLFAAAVLFAIGDAVPVRATLVLGGLLLAALGGAGVRAARRTSTGSRDAVAAD
jgi:MFS family permease